MNRDTIRVLSLTALAAMTPSFAGAQTFTGLGFLPGGTSSTAAAVSRDGTVVAGTSSTSQGNRAFRWTVPTGGGGGGMVNLGTVPNGSSSSAAGISDDGSVIVGTADISTVGVRAFRWTAAGMVNLGLPIDGGGDGEAYNSFGYGVSGDGLTVVGISDPVPTAFRNTSATGMVSIVGAPYSSAQDADADGLVVVGDTTSSTGDVAFRWTPPGPGGTGGMASLGVLPGGITSHAFGVSADGTVVVGWSHSSSGIRAFRWTPPRPGGTGGMVSLGVPPGQMGSRAYGVSADGNAVIGYSDISLARRPTIWNAAIGMVDLTTYLQSLGANLTGWTLTWVSGVSGDGRILVGYGTHNGASEAWVATVPPPPACFTLAGPQNAAACPTGTAVFSVSATGTGPFTYQWQIQSAPGSWTTLGNDPFPLPCGGFAFASQPFSSQTPIGIHPCPGTYAYQVRGIVTNACGSVTSTQATYTVCIADFDCSGSIQPADIAAFVNAWFDSLTNHTLDGDFDGNQIVNPADVAGFVATWFGALTTGC